MRALLAGMDLGYLWPELVCYEFGSLVPSLCLVPSTMSRCSKEALARWYYHGLELANLQNNVQNKLVFPTKLCSL
jgi:hypothetical protein